MSSVSPQCNELAHAQYINKLTLHGMTLSLGSHIVKGNILGVIKRIIRFFNVEHWLWVTPLSSCILIDEYGLQYARTSCDDHCHNEEGILMLATASDAFGVWVYRDLEDASTLHLVPRW